MLSGVTARNERGEWFQGFPASFSGTAAPRIGDVSSRPLGRSLGPVPCSCSYAGSLFFLLLSALTEQSISGDFLDFNTEKFELKIFRV